MNAATELRPARETIADSVFDLLVDSATRSFGFSTNEACILLDQGIAALRMAAEKGGEWRLSAPVDKALRLLMGHAVVLATIREHHGARVIRALKEPPEKSSDRARELESTAAAIAEVGLRLHDKAWKDQEPASAVLVCGRVLPRAAEPETMRESV